MIDKKELRLGNLVVLAHESNAPIAEVYELRNGICVVQMRGTCLIQSVGYDYLLPIDLNEHWLERLGFKKDIYDVIYFPFALPIENDSYIVSDGQRFWVEKVINYFGYSVGMGGGDKLHELQNIYYWVTNGKELTIKEPIK